MNSSIEYKTLPDHKMNEKLTTILRKIDLPTLIKLVGPVIVSAIDSVQETSDETAMASVLAMKYDHLVFTSKPIREAVINSLAMDDALLLGKKCGLAASDYKVYRLLTRFFIDSYNHLKSRILVDFFNLPQDFYFKQSIDERPDRERVTAPFGQEIKLLSYLHPYQKRIKDEAMKRLDYKFEKSFFIQMPTGAGKTYTALECVVDLMRKPRFLDDDSKPTTDKFVVWLVDRNELAEQALESFKRLWQVRGDHEIDVFRFFKNFEPDFPVSPGGIVFAGFDKMYAVMKNPEHSAFKAMRYMLNNTELLIVDEAHHSLADTYYACIQQFQQIPNIKLMGLSATPGTTDQETTRQLVELYSADKITIRDDYWKPVADPIIYLQEQKYLARLKNQLLETGIQASGNSEDTVLTGLAANSERNEKIMEQIQLADEQGEATIVFACTLDHVYALLVLCRAYKIKARYIIGDVEQVDRITILQDFKNREFNILINLDILSTGIDLPIVQKIIIARPISSPNLLSQILGRALRGPKNGGNEENIVINIKDNLINFPGSSFLYNYYQSDWEIVN